MDRSHQSRNTPEGTAAHGGIHVGAEEMRKKEGTMKEGGKKQGVAKNLLHTDPSLLCCPSHC